jgi:putative MATE family efflux protein
LYFKSNMISPAGLYVTIVFMSRRVHRMTEGNPAKLIFFFAVPLMLGNVFQQVYIITDTLIVSRTLGVRALAALGSTDWFSYMMISAVQAAAQGFSILIAQRFGAGDHRGVRRALARSVILSAAMTAVLTAASLMMIRPVMIFQNTPAEVRPMAEEYLRILFAGMPAMMLLNYGSSVLRALGDSRSPLLAMAISALLNVGLDYYLVVTLGTGVAGAAAATVAAQLIAGFYCLWVMKGIDLIRLEKADFRRSKGLDGELMKLSWPMMLQNLILSAGGIVVQSRVNTFELSAIAGYTAASKLYGALELAALAYGFAMVTYTGQNYGAKEYRRVFRGIRDSLVIGTLSAAAIGLVMLACGQNIIGFFLNEEGSMAVSALETGTQFLALMAKTLPVLYGLHIVRSVLQGLGDTVTPMLSGGAECIARMGMAVIVSRFIGWPAMIWAEVAAWIAADLVLFGSLYRKLAMMKDIMENGENNEQYE